MGIFGSSAKSKIQKLAAKKEKVNEVERLKYVVSKVDKAAEDGYFQTLIVIEKRDLRKVINELLKEKFGIVHSDPVKDSICLYAYWGPSKNRRSKFFNKDKDQWADELISQLETLLSSEITRKFEQNFDSLMTEEDLIKTRSTLYRTKVSWHKVGTK